VNEERIADLQGQMHHSQIAFMQEVDRLAMTSTGRTYAEVQHLAELHEQMIADSQAYMGALEDS
jgi:hypothetical protein